MFTCIICGYESSTNRSDVCGMCGSNFRPSEVDHPEELKRYYNATKEFFFDSAEDDDTQSLSLRLRKKFKISHFAHSKIYEKFSKKRALSEKLSKFSIEFDENILDAYAGGDTRLRFRIKNLSDTDRLKFTLAWDDKDTPDDIDFEVKSQSFIKPNQSEILAGTYTFSRFGPKEINNLQIFVADLEQDIAQFIASSFSFTVLNPDQKIVNNISTTTNISAQGYGMVGMVEGVGAAAGSEQASSNSQQDAGAKWEKLSISYKMASDNDFIESLVELVASSVMKEEEPVAPVAPISTSTQREEVENFFIALLELQKLLPESEKNRVVSATDISMQLLNVLHFKQLESELDSVIGVAFENPETVVLDSDNYITFFDGEATLVSLSGLTVVCINDGLVDWTIFYAWDQLKPNSLTFYRQRFGIGGYLISFGDESFKQNIPGLKFDLRRYKGNESLDQIFNKGMHAVEGILGLCPKSDSEKPRTNSDSSLAVEEIFTPPSNQELANSPAMEEAINNLANTFNIFDSHRADHGQNHFYYRYQITDQLLNVFDSVLPNIDSDDEIIGVLLEHPESIYINEESDELANFAGHANVITFSSISTVNNENNSISYVSEIPWLEAATEELGFWEDVVADDAQSICFGYVGRFYLFGGNWSLDAARSDDYETAMGNGTEALDRIFSIVRGEVDLNETLNQPLEEIEEDDEEEELAVEEEVARQTYNLPDGSIFIGTYDQNGLQTGFGEFHWPSGDTYCGEFLQGQFNGNGTLTYAAGGSYFGNWDMGQKQGFGILEFVDGSEYTGNFENNLIQGEGTYTFVNGDVYTGSFLNQRYEGVGTYTWSNGNEFTGEWSNGVKQGGGLMTYVDGTIQEGRWENDQFVG